MSHYCTLPECTIDFGHYHRASTGEPTLIGDPLPDIAEVCAERDRLKAELEEIKKAYNGTTPDGAIVYNVAVLISERDRLKAELAEAHADCIRLQQEITFGLQQQNNYDKNRF